MNTCWFTFPCGLRTCDMQTHSLVPLHTLITWLLALESVWRNIEALSPTDGALTSGAFGRIEKSLKGDYYLSLPFSMQAAAPQIRLSYYLDHLLHSDTLKVLLADQVGQGMSVLAINTERHRVLVSHADGRQEVWAYGETKDASLVRAQTVRLYHATSERPERVFADRPYCRAPEPYRVPTPDGNVHLLVACHNANGEPDLLSISVPATESDVNLGYHYDLAQSAAADLGYEAPFVCFDQHEQANLTRVLSQLALPVPFTLATSTLTRGRVVMSPESIQLYLSGEHGDPDEQGLVMSLDVRNGAPVVHVYGDRHSDTPTRRIDLT